MADSSHNAAQAIEQLEKKRKSLRSQAGDVVQKRAMARVDYDIDQSLRSEEWKASSEGVAHFAGLKKVGEECTEELSNLRQQVDDVNAEILRYEIEKL